VEKIWKIILQLEEYPRDPRVVYFKNWLYKVWKGKGDVYDRAERFFEERRDFITKLSNYAHETWKMDVEFQASGFSEDSFTTLFRTSELGGDFVAYYAPQLYYRLLPNEIVFDIETREREIVKGAVRWFHDHLIEPLVATTGGRGFHFHFFVKPRGYDLSRYTPESIKKFANGVFEYLLDKMPQEVRDHVDTGVQLHPHTIRALWSLNIKDGKIGVKRPLIGDKYPNKIPTWHVPESIVETVRSLVKERQREEEVMRRIEQEDNLERYRREFMSDDRCLEEVMQILEDRKAKESSNYITFHCPFHPPDEQPSFVFYKNTCIFIDFHNWETFKPRQLLKKLKEIGGVSNE